jgi:excisionase family DNA binding protein
MPVKRRTLPIQEISAPVLRRGYRISEAAEYMGISPWFVELKIRSKELPALRLCRHYTILKEDMDAFLDAEKAKAA